MECKAEVREKFHWGEKNWNISRMECKDYQAYQDLVALVIGIYPEWNVKSISLIHSLAANFIGIYPEWNVKIDNFKYGALKLEIGIYPEWNVKKSDVTANHKNITIGIYTEWNVKVSTSITSKPFTSLEYIQNGM